MGSPADFSALEAAAGKQEAEETAARMVRAARSRLTLGTDARSAFFTVLALRLKPEVDWAVPTMATDGKALAYNPDFVVGLTPDELLGVVAHEALHCGLAHHCRRGNRSHERWNEGCDLAVNQVVLDAGFALPATRLMPGEGKYAHLPLGKSAEEYYDLLSPPPQPEQPEPDDGEEETPAGDGDGDQGEDEENSPDEQEGGDGDGDGEPEPDPNGQPQDGSGDGGQPSTDPGGCGEVRDAGDPAEQADEEAAWGSAVAQAETASRTRGELPGGLARLVGAVLRPPADWREVLRAFVDGNARSERSWSKPNRRYVAQGLYLPGKGGKKLRRLVLAVDTSGSVGRAELAAFGGEAEAAATAADCAVTVLYHDAAITHVQEWEPTDGPLVLEPKGGGGTSHVPVFDYIAREGLDPSCVICLTDGYTSYPPSPPDCATLWAFIGDNQERPPFGGLVRIQ